MIAIESPSWEAILICLGPILYVGIFSSGIAYTLQILAQKDSNPTVVSLLLSLESVFATLSGALILGDQMSGKEYFGCLMMLVAVVLAQLPDRKSCKNV
jgi:drug/metabolite transporter (DMT)-like permease